MKLVVRNAKSKEGKPYVALVATTDYGQTFITFDKRVIAMLLPMGMSIMYLPEGETVIGEIYENL